MRRIKTLLALLSVLLLAYFVACERDEILTAGSDGRPTDSDSRRLLTALPADTCSTAQCIEDYFNAFYYKGELVISDASSPYGLDEHYVLGEDTDSIQFHMRGFECDPPCRPELMFTTQYVYGQDEKHASLHICGPASMNSHVLFQDVSIWLAAKMDRNGQVAGIQFEGSDVDLVNTKLTNDPGNLATTHFMTMGTVTLDNCEVSTGHELAFGPEDWCGEEICGGFGNPMPGNGSEIKNSEMYGEVFFDVYRSTALSDTARFYFRDNNPLTDIYLNGNEGAKLKVVLEDNTFASYSRAFVVIDDAFVVEARRNVTTKGPCLSDALEDFDYTGSNLGAAALVLDSWKYDGTTYCLPEIGDFGASRVTNTVYAEWVTECAATSVVQWGTSSASLTNTATGSDGMMHSVSFSVPSDEGCIYLRAISAIPGCSCDADTSETVCLTKDIVISNVQKVFSSLACTFTVTWTTNVKSSSTVDYGPSCVSLEYSADGANNVTSHSVVCDVSGISGGVFAFKVSSGNSCDSVENTCSTARRNTCVGQ